MVDPSLYQANQPYRYEYKEDSRSSMVPPPETTHSDQKIVLQLPPQKKYAALQHDFYGNSNFIAALAQTYDLSREYAISNWAYNDRHTAQEILPFMLLGPMSFARNSDLVREAGISMMIAVRSKRIAEARPAYMDPSKFPSAKGMQTATFDVDSPFDIITNRAGIIKQINDHLEASSEPGPTGQLKGVSGKVLVFCETGNERSPVLTALYLMTVWGLDAFSSVQVVQARRFGIAINSEMIAMLQDTQQIMDAERQVATSVRAPPAMPGTAKKRNIDQAYEAEGARTLQDRIISQGHRYGTVPFIDAYNGW